MKIILHTLLLLGLLVFTLEAKSEVLVLPMQMEILPGTASYLEDGIKEASRRGAKLVLVELDTPGGMLQSSQEMVKAIFDSEVPVVIYVSPTGGSATSAGVFITVAGHVAAMAPGTSIGAAHPVMGSGEDIPGDMRTKAENITVAMVKSIAEKRGRNVAWVEKAVKESASLTETEAEKEKVVEIIAKDLDELLKKLKGRKVEVAGKTVELEDFSSMPRVNFEPSIKQKFLNFVANPMIAHILWIGATTGLSLELYSPGAILPGVVGVICLILALAVYQIIPLNVSGILLLVAGAVMIALEFAVPSGILGVAGIIAMVIGSIYLVDLSVEPFLQVNLTYIGMLTAFVGSLMFGFVWLIVRTKPSRAKTGYEGLIGKTGEALETITSRGRVSVNGEIWNATVEHGVINKGEKVKVVGMAGSLILEVEQFKE